MAHESVAPESFVGKESLNKDYGDTLSGHLHTYGTPPLQSSVSKTPYALLTTSPFPTQQASASSPTSSTSKCSNNSSTRRTSPSPASPCIPASSCPPASIPCSTVFPSSGGSPRGLGRWYLHLCRRAPGRRRSRRRGRRCRRSGRRIRGRI
jgi:hypothetical protein